MDSTCIEQTVCKVLNIFQHGKYLVAYVLKAHITKSRMHLSCAGISEAFSTIYVDSSQTASVG